MFLCEESTDDVIQISLQKILKNNERNMELQLISTRQFNV